MHLIIEMSDNTLAAIRADPEAFARELRLAAAVKWYELRRITQEIAAKIAEISRAEFVVAVGRFGVSPFRCMADEAVQEADRR